MYFKVCEIKIDNFILNYIVEFFYIVILGLENYGYF